MNESQSDSFWSFSSATPGLSDDWRDVTLLHSSTKGWCDIYTCNHRGRKLVLKALKEQYRQSQVHIDLLHKEYTISSGMFHPHIVAAHGLETVSGLGLCIVMEYVDGVTLPQYLAQRGILTQVEVKRLIGQICSAAAYIHSRQIVHCDIKPSNILITRQDSYVKIIDFGLARGFGYEQLDFSGGTNGFTAPENLKEGILAHPSMDIYSIGRIIEYLNKNHRYRSLVARCCAIDASKRVELAELIPKLMKRVERRKQLVLGGSILSLIAIFGLFAIYTKNENNRVQEVQTLPELITQDTITVTPVEPQQHTRPQAKPAIASESPKTVEKPIEELVEAPVIPPFDEQYYQYVLKCAEKRFNDHLTMIDTMTTQYSNQLVAVNHWRWLAKQDVRQWLEESLSANNPRIESLMEDAAKAIVAYGEDPDRMGEEYKRKVATIRRIPDLNGVTTEYSYYIDDDRICTRTFMEDGTWKTVVKSLTPRP